MSELILEELGPVSESANQELQVLNNRSLAEDISGQEDHLVLARAQIRNQWIPQLEVAVKEPFVCFVRAECENEEGKSGARIYLVHRHGKMLSNYSSKSQNTFLCAYLAPAGRIAAIPFGDYIDLPNNDEVCAVERNLFVPVNTSSGWDAIDNKIETGNDRGTVQSLKKFFLDAELEQVTIDREKKTVQSFELRDQPILDSKQDDIFRTPLNSRIFVTGAPGTGKTTLLIKRLAQKTSVDNLSEDESVLVRPKDKELFHARNWTLYVPSQGLRDYLKNAMSQESISADVETIKLWSEESIKIAKRHYLGTGEGFSLKKDRNILSVSSSSGLAKVATDFYSYVGQRYSVKTDLNKLRYAFIKRIPEYYRIFRGGKGGEFFNTEIDYKQSLANKEISPDEVDIINFTVLKYARFLESKRPENFKSIDWYDTIKINEKTQIAVDEFSDFSAVQLGCIFYLAHPRFRSFTLVGDLMQRITRNGIQQFSECNLFASDFRVHQVGRHYRQSEKLAQMVATLYKHKIGEDPPFLSIENKDVHPVPPLLYSAPSSEEGVAWIGKRVQEIYRYCEEKPAIAVVVPEQSNVQPMTSMLQKVLKDGVEVYASVDGKIESTKDGVYVFPVEHIKGFEFEGVFLVGIARMASLFPELIDKYLYVAITRASRFLGVVSRDENEFPESLNCVKDFFVEGETWEYE